jgi:hypothetical protein
VCVVFSQLPVEAFLSAARTRLFKFRLRLWFVITLYSYGTDFGIHNV